MKPPVNIYDAKTQLSRLVDQAMQGEDVVIARSGKPVARLTRLGPQPKKRRLGLLDGQFKIPDDFNAPLPTDVLSAFEGGD
jgi:antitoxin (DNA-binding transcriptional repressor) of toxin-antitoxin stability system